MTKKEFNELYENSKWVYLKYKTPYSEGHIICREILLEYKKNQFKRAFKDCEIRRIY